MRALNPALGSAPRIFKTKRNARSTSITPNKYHTIGVPRYRGLVLRELKDESISFLIMRSAKFVYHSRLFPCFAFLAQLFPMPHWLRAQRLPHAYVGSVLFLPPHGAAPLNSFFRQLVFLQARSLLLRYFPMYPCVVYFLLLRVMPERHATATQALAVTCYYFHISS